MLAFQCTGIEMLTQWFSAYSALVDYTAQWKATQFTSKNEDKALSRIFNNRADQHLCGCVWIEWNKQYVAETDKSTINPFLTGKGTNALKKSILSTISKHVCNFPTSEADCLHICKLYNCNKMTRTLWFDMLNYKQIKETRFSWLKPGFN